MHQAVCEGRPGSEGDLLWNALLIGRWASSSPPSPVLEPFRNDLALLLADHLGVALELPLMRAELVPDADRNLEPTTPAHHMLGMWAFAHEVATGIEAVVASNAIQSEHAEGMLPDQVRPAPAPGT
jgi:hypothetical protein